MRVFRGISSQKILPKRPGQSVGQVRAGKTVGQQPMVCYSDSCCFLLGPLYSPAPSESAARPSSQGSEAWLLWNCRSSILWLFTRGSSSVHHHGTASKAAACRPEFNAAVLTLHRIWEETLCHGAYVHLKDGRVSLKRRCGTGSWRTEIKIKCDQWKKMFMEKSCSSKSFQISFTMVCIVRKDRIQ